MFSMLQQLRDQALEPDCLGWDHSPKIYLSMTLGKPLPFLSFFFSSVKW